MDELQFGDQVLIMGHEDLGEYSFLTYYVERLFCKLAKRNKRGQLTRDTVVVATKELVRLENE